MRVDTITVFKDDFGRSYNLLVEHDDACPMYTGVTAHAVTQVLAAAARNLLSRVDDSNPSQLEIFWAVYCQRQSIPRCLHGLRDEWSAVMDDALSVAELPTPRMATISPWFDA